MGNTRCYPLLPLVGVNNRQPILNMSRIMLHLYSKDYHIDLFEIDYMINPSLHINKVFR